jgi:hypothetical protein
MPELPLTFKLFATLCVLSAVALMCWQEEITASFEMLREAYDKNNLPETLPVVAALFSRKFDFLFLFAANIAALLIAGAGKSRKFAEALSGRRFEHQHHFNRFTSRR